MELPSGSRAENAATGAVAFSAYSIRLIPLICAGSFSLVTPMVTSMLAAAPDGSVAMTCTVYLLLASKSRGAFVLIWPLFLAISKDAASTPPKA